MNRFSVTFPFCERFEKDEDYLRGSDIQVYCNGGPETEEWMNKLMSEWMNQSKR